jgi:hypothetical protein
MKLTVGLGFTLLLAVLGLAPTLAQDSSHAVIIEGWTPEQGASHQGGDTLRDELWNDCFLMFEQFYSRPAIDSDPSRIHMLWADGADYWRKGRRYNPAWLRLDTLTDAPGDTGAIRQCFASLVPRMTAADTLFCYTWGHGGHDRGTARNSSHFSIEVRPITGTPYNWNSTPLWDTALARMVKPIPAQRVFIMQQCHGGGFVDDLADERTVMICAGATGEKTRSCDDMPNDTFPSSWPENEVYPDTAWRHCEFSFHFMNALRRTAVFKYDTVGTGYENPDSVDADTSEDGIVSWYEAFRYEQKCNSRNEIPVFYDPSTTT